MSCYIPKQPLGGWAARQAVQQGILDAVKELEHPINARKAAEKLCREGYLNLGTGRNNEEILELVTDIIADSK